MAATASTTTPAVLRPPPSPFLFTFAGPVGALASALVNASPEQQRTMLQGNLWPLVEQLEPDAAAEVTEILLKMDQTEVLHLLESPAALKEKVAKAMEVLRNDIPQPQQQADAQGDGYYGRYWPLYRIVEKNDWKGVEDFVTHHTDALTANIGETGFNMSIFHLISALLVDVESDEATCLFDKLASMVDVETLARLDSSGFTALSLCAAKGNLKAVKVLVKHHPELTKKKTFTGILPVQLAAFHGHKEIFQYLLEVTNGVDIYSGVDGASVLSYLVQGHLYDVALDLLKHHPTIGRDNINSRSVVLNSLAQKPYAFESGSRLGRLQRIIYNCIPVTKEQVSSLQTNYNQNVDGDMENLTLTSTSHSKNSTCFGSTKQITASFGAMWHKLHRMLWNALTHLAPIIKVIQEQKLTHMQSVEIVRIILEGVIWNNFENTKHLSGAMFTAAKLGISEFVNEYIMAYDYSASWTTFDDQHNIFDLAVLHRREKVFNLLHCVTFTIFSMSLRDKSGNNILHLAGRLGPSSEVAGAALQMQRELQWFKLVESLVHPSYRGAINCHMQTPRGIFTESHKDLVKDGETWMKETASSCSVVAALIITVVFAAAFTVPGGNDSRGIPNFLHDPSFMIFAISDMLALFSSITSVLMFLGILTSRYAEDDFLVSLPRKLIIGLITLFFSIASMMVAFGATVYISISHKWNLVFIPIALVGCVPVTLFVLLQFPLLVEIYLSTYGRGIFKESSWRELTSRHMVAKGNYKSRVLKAD